MWNKGKVDQKKKSDNFSPKIYSMFWIKSKLSPKQFSLSAVIVFDLGISKIVMKLLNGELDRA